VLKSNITEAQESRFSFLHIFFIVCCLIGASYFSLLEILQVLKEGLMYFSSKKNIIDILMLSLNISVLISDLLNVSYTQLTQPLALGVLFMWIEFFMQGRIFLETAWMIRMINSSIQELGYFVFVFM